MVTEGRSSLLEDFHRRETVIREALELGLQAWRTTPVREKFHRAFEALDSLEDQRLRKALTVIAGVPSERTLLLNAEARAMYEIATRALEAERP